MSNVITELLLNPTIPPIARPFVLALCKGEGGVDEKAWGRCYGGTIYTGPLNVAYNKANPLWPGKQGPSGMSHALGAAQFQPGTYEEVAARTGLTTLVPQSQLTNTWNHVQAVYLRVTGRNALADLTNGKWQDVAKALAPTWTSLGLTDLLTKRYNTSVAEIASLGTTPPSPIPPVIPPAPLDDIEIEAIIAILQALKPLDAAARHRVFKYVAARLVI